MKKVLNQKTTYVEGDVVTLEVESIIEELIRDLKDLPSFKQEELDEAIQKIRAQADYVIIAAANFEEDGERYVIYLKGMPSLNLCCGLHQITGKTGVFEGVEEALKVDPKTKVRDIFNKGQAVILNLPMMFAHSNYGSQVSSDMLRKALALLEKGKEPYITIIDDVRLEHLSPTAQADPENIQIIEDGGVAYMAVEAEGFYQSWMFTRLAPEIEVSQHDIQMAMFRRFLGL